MSTGSSIPYRLRPNKSVDRELFLSLLTRIAAKLELEQYQYIGLGGPFLEDFRLVHARLGIESMICVESEEPVHQRQLFNRPVDCISCVHSTLEDYIDRQDFVTPIVMWLDYTKPGDVADQIERFARTIGVSPIGSVLRVTLNANPSSLGSPSVDELMHTTVQEWRLERFRDRLGRFFPSGLSSEGMKYKTFGRSILSGLMLASENEALNHPDRDIVWALSTHYADGQPMVTAALVIIEPDDCETVDLVTNWEFYSTPKQPQILDMPALSTLERLKMESTSDPRDELGFLLPKSDMGEDPFAAFRKFYRIYPHFSRVEL